MGWNGRKSAIEIAEEKMDTALSSVGVSAGLTVGQSQELADTVKTWVRALVEEEKNDLRNQINKTGEWSRDY